jgi:uncharacterized damage-inducible protein DinB
MKTFALFTTLALAARLLSAQSESEPKAGANPLVSSSRVVYEMVNQNVLRAAEEMPEENYSFRPTPEVRTFGQLVGHVADGQYEFCSAAVGDQTRGPQVEKNVTTKADLIEALKKSFQYCDKAYDGLTDAHAADLVPFFGRSMPKLTLLDFNIAHTDEHYGNMVTYLRMKGLVPPSSQPRRK